MSYFKKCMDVELKVYFSEKDFQIYAYNFLDSIIGLVCNSIFSMAMLKYLAIRIN